MPIFGHMLSSPLRLDQWACLDMCEMLMLRDKHNVQNPQNDTLHTDREVSVWGNHQV